MELQDRLLVDILQEEELEMLLMFLEEQVEVLVEVVIHHRDHLAQLLVSLELQTLEEEEVVEHLIHLLLVVGEDLV
jgi:hypothetical protein